MKLSSDQIETYHRDGVLPLGQVLDKATVATACERLEALRRRDLMDNPSQDPARASFRLLNVSSHDDWFMTIVRNANVLDAAESILGPNIQYFQDNIFYKPARHGAPTQWHQDNIWWHADPPNVLTIWIALDDVDANNGAVRYIPGSHHHLVEAELEVHDPKAGTYNMLAPSQVDESSAVQFVVPAGHAVMHHCMTIHGAPPNDSNRTRRGFTVHLQQAGLLNTDPEKTPILRGSMTP
ncbi:MAG: phytanoyl-CoA dioxygenase family protein [Verrucomicrobia bacterium]|nr:phytanoyl-CoA dioxygenase family protein [Verrucomicrobiota bacterium]